MNLTEVELDHALEFFKIRSSLTRGKRNSIPQSRRGTLFQLPFVLIPKEKPYR